MGGPGRIRPTFGNGEKADAIFERFGASWTGIELLHEAAERYLKGYLIHHGWQLIKTHDLSRLLAEACCFECDLERFAETTQSAFPATAGLDVRRSMFDVPRPLRPPTSDLRPPFPRVSRLHAP